MATAMARASSGLAYPDRFYAAASYAGFGGSPTSSNKGAISKFNNEVALLLYGLYQQVDVAELRQKLQTVETLQKELELLQRQKAASEEAALHARQRQGSGGVWGWIAGTPTQNTDA